MIVPMFKYAFLIHQPEVEGFLDDLMEMGMVHVIEKGSPENREITDLAQRIKDSEGVIKTFERRKVKSNGEQFDLDVETMPTLKDVGVLEKEHEKLLHDIEVCKSEIDMLRPWGEVPWELLRSLEQEKGIRVRLFAYPERKFNKEWSDTFPLEIINKERGILYFAVFHENEEIVLPLVPLVLPKKTIQDLESDLHRMEQRVEDISNTLDEWALKYGQLLKERVVEVKDILAYKVAANQVEEPIEALLNQVDVWCPSTKVKDLEAYADRKGLVFVKSDPGEEEVPPVLLRNNRFSKLFEPIGNLFSLPAYSELDLTVYFAPFFLLFFGFCLGDTGYGLVILLVTSLLKLKMKGDARPFLTLGQLFGLSTTVIGFFSGTLFGIPMLEEDYFAPIHGVLLNQDQLFNVALGIGFVQIIFGMAVQVYKQVIFKGWLYALNRIGWIIMLLSLVDLYVIEGIPGVSGISVWIGLGLVVLFGSPEGGPLKSVGLGIADLYNITGVMGDLLSYIRLFALGVSSAILGLVVNSIAFSAQGVPYVGIVLTIIILIVGHTANMMLASLSAFVHPMRLTFVEFYKNVGFIGGGKPFKAFEKKYQPLKNQNKQE